MKKAVVIFLTLALVLSMLAVFVACDKDDTQTASNAEVLGTTVAVVAQYTGASVASEQQPSASFDAGVNLDVSDGANLSFGSQAVASGIGEFVKPILQSAVNNVKDLLGENGITVGKVDNDDTNYDEKYAITITHIDEKTAEETTEKLALYIKITSDKGSVEGKTDYTFDAKVVWVIESDKEDVTDREVELTSFSGKASFDDIKDTMIFDLGAGAGNADSANAFAGIKAYGTATGSVVVEMGAGAGISETIGASASLSIEVGKLADGKFGAIVTANGKASIPAVGNADVVASVNVYANSKENAGEFALNGKLEITLDAQPLGVSLGKYKGTATLDGKAVYDADKDEAVIGISGTIGFEKIEEENK